MQCDNKDRTEERAHIHNLCFINALLLVYAQILKWGGFERLDKQLYGRKVASLNKQGI